MDSKALKTTKSIRFRKISSNKSLDQSNSFRKNAQEYLESSTFHGLNYVGNIQLTIPERFHSPFFFKYFSFPNFPFHYRIFFVFAFLLVTALSAYYISIMWIKWGASPIIVSSAPKMTYITETPFPAVTICNMNQAKKSMAKDIVPNSFDDLQLKTLCMRNEVKRKTGNFSSSWEGYKSFVLRVLYISMLRLWNR